MVLDFFVGILFLLIAESSQVHQTNVTSGYGRQAFFSTITPSICFYGRGGCTCTGYGHVSLLDSAYAQLAGLTVSNGHVIRQSEIRQNPTVR